MATAQQFVGVNTLIYYAPTILSDTGMGNSAALGATILVGVTNVVFTIISVLLLDRVGRRNFSLEPAACCWLSSSWVSTSPVALFKSGSVGSRLAVSYFFIASFAIGLWPVFWLMICEIFPAGLRSKAMSVCTIVNWGTNFLVAQTFLPLSGAIARQGVFFLYAALAIASVTSSACESPKPADEALRRSRPNRGRSPVARRGAPMAHPPYASVESGPARMH